MSQAKRVIGNRTKLLASKKIKENNEKNADKNLHIKHCNLWIQIYGL